MKLSSELIKNITKELEAGNYVVDVCEYLGIDESTFYIWKKQYRELRKKFKAKEIEKRNFSTKQKLLVKFFKSTKKAEKTAILNNVKNIQRSAFGTSNKYDQEGNLISKGLNPEWQASAWFLERRDYKKFGRKDYLKQNLDAKIKSSIKYENIDFSKLGEEEAKKKYEELNNGLHTAN
jgi:hypothetical protein